MLIAIILLIILLLVITIIHSRQSQSFEDFTVAGKKQGVLPVYLSLMTSMIGASATLGVCDRVISIGFPAFWWLGAGVFGLVIQGFFLSDKISELGANTLPDIADKTVGHVARIMISFIIVVSWTGIIAAQIASLCKIIGNSLGNISSTCVTVVIGIIVIIYTVIGGQLSVVKTDMIQAMIVFLGIVGTFIYLYIFKNKNNELISNDIALINDSFSFKDVINMVVVTGGTYFLGPDIISRNIMSKNRYVAKKSVFLAALSLCVIGVIVTLLGMWTVYNVESLNGYSALVYIMNNEIPESLAVILCLALIASLISSADTCLVNAATIIEHDIFKRKSIKETRVLIGVLGCFAIIIALFKSDIIDLLMAAYSVYSPGIVCPLFVSITFYKRKKINKFLWYLGVMSGSLIGMLNPCFNIGPDYLPVIGMVISLIFSLLGVGEVKSIVNKAT